MDNVIINGVEYAPVSSPDDERMRIVIADNRGLTFVGKCRLPDGDGLLLIRDARCVIVWGTNGHLAQLAASGKLKDTKLGAARDVLVQSRNIVAIYECSEAWNEQ